VYSFDPVGSYEREACRGAGAAQSLLQPFLDNQVSCAACGGYFPPLSLLASNASLTAFLLDLQQEPDTSARSGTIRSRTIASADCSIPRSGCFHGTSLRNLFLHERAHTHRGPSYQSATERHIEVGDGLEMYVVMAQGRSAEDLTSEEAQKSKEWPSDLTVQEVESMADEEDEGKAYKVFCLRRPLKRD
jgi:20S proteasome subunit beta 6